MLTKSLLVSKIRLLNFFSGKKEELPELYVTTQLMMLKYLLNLLANIYIVFALPDLYRENVYEVSIKSNISVTSISSCYLDCWNNDYKCCAVGFLSSDINTRRNLQSITCYMISCERRNIGKLMTLEVLVRVALKTS